MKKSIKFTGMFLTLMALVACNGVSGASINEEKGLEQVNKILNVQNQKSFSYPKSFTFEYHDIYDISFTKASDSTLSDADIAALGGLINSYDDDIMTITVNGDQKALYYKIDESDKEGLYHTDEFWVYIKEENEKKYLYYAEKSDWHDEDDPEQTYYKNEINDESIFEEYIDEFVYFVYISGGYYLEEYAEEKSFSLYGKDNISNESIKLTSKGDGSLGVDYSVSLNNYTMEGSSTIANGTVSYVLEWENNYLVNSSIAQNVDQEIDVPFMQYQIKGTSHNKINSTSKFKEEKKNITLPDLSKYEEESGD